jgi:hypothetical protein
MFQSLKSQLCAITQAVSVSFWGQFCVVAKVGMIHQKRFSQVWLQAK